MLSFLRGAGPVRTNTAAHNPVVYEDGRSSLSFRAPGSEYCMTHVLPPTTAAHGASLLTPPLHYHIHQDEFFGVRRGVGHLYRGLAAAPFAVLTGGSSSGSDDDNGKPSSTTSTNKAMVKAGRYHRFENASPTEALFVDVHLAGPSIITSHITKYLDAYLGRVLKTDCGNSRCGGSRHADHFIISWGCRDDRR